MAEKKPKRRAAKKMKDTSTTTSRKKRGLHPADVRHDVLEMVEEHAHKMTEAVIEQAELGQLATVKYLFEAANILPAPKDGSEVSKEEDSLAETLLDRLNIPKVPVARDEEDDSIVPESDDANALSEEVKSEDPE